MKGKIRGYTGQIGFYKVPEEMKNSLTYTSPFIDFFKEITDFKFHTSPPQDVFYHPIENRVDTTPVLFYWKITFTNYDGYQTDYNWSSSSTGSFSLSYHQAQFQIFHPYANIRRIELQDIEVNDEGNEIRTINSGVFYYNSSHLYSYTFPDNCIRRVIRLKFFRWEDSTPYIANITIHNEEYNFHRYPPQDVFYHPIESRVDTTPITFYYKVSLYSSPNLQNPIYDSGWKTTNLSAQNPYRSAKIELFHPFSNIRQIKIEHKYLTASNNELPIETIELSYNSQHLYSFNFNIDNVQNPEDKLVRIFRIYAKRWEDTNYIHLYTIKLTSSIIYSRILYSLVQGETPTLLGVNWTSYGGSYTFDWIDGRLELKFAHFEGVNAIVNNTTYNTSPASVDFSVGNNFNPYATFNISNNTFSKQISLTSNALAVSDSVNNKWYGKDYSVTPPSPPSIIIFAFHDAPSISNYWKLGVKNLPKEVYMTAGPYHNNTRTRTVSLNSNSVTGVLVANNHQYGFMSIGGETTIDGIPVFVIDYQLPSLIFLYYIKKGNNTFTGICDLTNYQSPFWLPDDNNKILHITYNSSFGIISCAFLRWDVDFKLFTFEWEIFGSYTYNRAQQSGSFNQAYIEKF